MKFIEGQRAYFRTLKGKELICLGCETPVKSKNDAVFSYVWTPIAKHIPPMITAYHKKCFDSMKKELSGLSMMYTPAVIEAEKIPSYLRFVKFLTFGYMIIPLLFLVGGMISLGILVMNSLFPGRLSPFFNLSGMSGLLFSLSFLLVGIIGMYFLIANLINAKKIRRFLNV